MSAGVELLKERWVVRILATRDPDEPVPTLWGWDIEGADVVVLSGKCVGLVAPASSGEECSPGPIRVDSGGKR